MKQLIQSKKQINRKNAQLFFQDAWDSYENNYRSLLPDATASPSQLFKLVTVVLGVAKGEQGKIKEKVQRLIKEFLKRTAGEEMTAKLGKQLIMKVIEQEQHITVNYKGKVQTKAEEQPPGRLTPLEQPGNQQQPEQLKQSHQESADCLSVDLSSPLQFQTHSSPAQELAHSLIDQSTHQSRHKLSHSFHTSPKRSLLQQLINTIQKFQSIRRSMSDSSQSLVLDSLIASLRGRMKALISVSSPTTSQLGEIQGRLRQAFYWFCKKKFISTDNLSFDAIQKKLNFMNTSRFLQFCSEFRLLSPSFTKEQALTAFKRLSCNQLMNADQLVLLLKQIAQKSSKGEQQGFVHLMSSAGIAEQGEFKRIIGGSEQIKGNLIGSPRMTGFQVRRGQKEWRGQKVVEKTRKRVQQLVNY